MRLHFYVNKQLVERVEHVGSLLGHTKARAAAFLLDNASQIEEQAMAVLDRRLQAVAAAMNQPRGEQRSAESSADEVVLMYVRLEPNIARRIEHLAQQRNLSLSKVCAWLLNRAVEEDGWIVEIVQSRLAEALAKRVPDAR